MQERMDLLVSPDFRDLVDLLDLREKEESLVCQEAVVHWDHLDLVDLLDPVVNRESRENPELQEDLVG